MLAPLSLVPPCRAHFTRGRNTNAPSSVRASAARRTIEKRDDASARGDIVDGRRRVLGALIALTCSMTTNDAAMAKDGKNGVYFIEPRDKATVGRQFDVKMGVKGYELAPAANGLQEGTGHHHLIIDGPTFVEKGTEIPFDETHLHFGKAQKEGVVNLTPGEHTLTLQFADAKHRSFGKKFAKHITVIVE